MLRNTYLYLLWLKNKKLFYAVSTIIILTLFTNLTRNEITPFYVWSMYSAKSPQTDTFAIYTMKYNGKEYSAPHTWKDHKRMMFFYPIEYYTSIIDNKGEADAGKMVNGFQKIHLDPAFTNRIYNTPAQLNGYPIWLKRYLEANEGIKVDSLQVSRQWLMYDNDSKVHSVKSDLLFNI